jgi:hypothetical protein
MPKIPADYTALITTHDGWWFRYTVTRHHGMFNLERTHSHHRTLRGARRSARRWTARNETSEPQVVEWT